MRRAAIGVSAIPLAPPTPKTWGGAAALSLGGVAQLGERLLCKQEVIGSIPFTSTTRQRRAVRRDNGNSCYRESGSEQEEAPGF